jgi:malonate-semialdehyde dehydrogenase (acetylating)/methylmalonate-semialdehyde dehydrogenase
MGPLVTRQHRDKVAGYVDQGVKEGAKLVVDGRGQKVPGHESGFFLGTTLFDNVKPEMKIYQDEIFGPVLVVLRAKTLEEAIALVNRNPYANGTAIFTESGGAARRFENEIQVGMVGVNVPIPVPVAFYSLALRRPARARHGGRQVLHPYQGHHDALAAPGHAGAGVQHAHFRVNSER